MTVVDLIDRQTCLYLPLRDNIRLQGEAGTLLSASYEGRLLIFRQGSMRIKTHEVLLFHSHRIIAEIVARNRILQLHPFESSCCRRILGIRFQMLLKKDTWQGISLHQSIDRHPTIHYRPLTFLPLHRSQIGLSTQVMIRTAIVAVCQEHHPPVAISCLY